MLLRTSSSPIFQALLSPTFPDTPSKRDLLINAALSSSAVASAPSSSSSPRCQIFRAKSNLGSPRFNKRPNNDESLKLRRAFSDSNLEDLASPTFQRLPEVPRSSKKMETAPSLSISGFDLEEEKDVNENGDFGSVGDDEEEGVLVRSATIGDVISAVDGIDFCFGRTTDMGLIAEGEEEEDVEEEEKDVFDPCPSPPMYLATGLGVDVVPGAHLSPNFDDEEVAEEYYRKMVEKFPTHPLLLRNYAELLKIKGDLRGAEEYYHRAILADPEDGEILSQYAKLVWEVHHDEERAGEYFERAAHASPQDSHVLAAVASFLWQTDDSETRDFSQSNDDKIGENNHSSVCHEDGVAANIIAHHTTGGGKEEVSSSEEHYKQLVEQNPSNAMVLRNYAHFLYKSKGDLQGAEVYYSRAILADPQDGEILSQYATLLWELYQDEGKARSYFERSVQASPSDSHVLAAYACFLWETGEEDEDDEDALPSSFQPQFTPQLPALKGV
ncbi:hypothetical protein V2J09_015876 [Rumex salicifolius]